MKIGIICYPTFGGSGIVATEIGKYFAQQNHQVHFICYDYPVRLDEFSKNIKYHQVNIDEYPLFRYQPYELALSSKIVNVVIQYKLDLIHAHYAIPHAYATYTAKQILSEKNIHIPFVTTLHGTDITLVGKNPSYKNAVSFSIKKSNAVTSVSKSLKNDTYNFFEIDKEISVIPNFIDIEKYQNIQNYDRDLFATKNEKIIIHISNFRPVKRIEDVIKTFYLIEQKVKSKLILVGEGPDKEKIQVLAKELGIYKKIHFVGNHNQVEKLLSISDLFLMCSTKESFGLVVLEAMAGKTPILSTNIGGLPEVVVHKKTGFLNDIGNVEKMAKDGISLLSDENKLNEFKKNAFEHAKNFDSKRVIPLYEEIYHKIITEK